MKIKSFLICITFIPSIMFCQMENVTSTLEVYDIVNDKRAVIYAEDDHFEAPNWSKDGKYFILNSSGKLFTLDLKDKKKSFLNTGFADRCNNDHGISPDGTQLVISHHGLPGDKNDSGSRIYLLPIIGGTPRLVTPLAPSYWHGWSSDGRTLLYVAQRNDDYNIYAINVNGGDEIRLTSDPGLDDGPEYSVDGKYIYYNSMKSGKMEIWRMKSNGNEQEQLTDDQYSNWFPHPSPDGKYLVYLSYLEQQGDSHPAMKNVALRLYHLHDNSIRTLCKFTGGQGTINVPSWSPDSKKFAFVSYQSL